MRLRDRLDDPKKLLVRVTMCVLRGHYSTGLMLWWMCDRCHTDFSAAAKPSRWIGDSKITTSR